MIQNRIINPVNLKVGDVYLYQFVPESPCIYLGNNLYLDVNNSEICKEFGLHEKVMLVSSFSDHYNREHYDADITKFRF